MMREIVEQTNKYAAECMGERYHTWDEVSIDELPAFFGFMILMGIVSLPSIADYWKQDDALHYDPIASRISRNRFFDIQRYIHFADNNTLHPSGHPEYD